MPHGVVVNLGERRIESRRADRSRRKSFAGLEGLDLAKDVTSRQSYKWDETPWAWNEGYGKEGKPDLPRHGASIMA